MDSGAREANKFTAMSKALNVTPKSVVIDLALTGIVWILFTLWFRGHVPSEEPTTILLVAAYAAIPAAATFWLCLQMFKVTLAFQRQEKAERSR